MPNLHLLDTDRYRLRPLNQVVWSSTPSLGKGWSPLLSEEAIRTARTNLRLDRPGLQAAPQLQKAG